MDIINNDLLCRTARKIKAVSEKIIDYYYYEDNIIRAITIPLPYVVNIIKSSFGYSDKTFQKYYELVKKEIINMLCERSGDKKRILEKLYKNELKILNDYQFWIYDV